MQLKLNNFYFSFYSLPTRLVLRWCCVHLWQSLCKCICKTFYLIVSREMIIFSVCATLVVWPVPVVELDLCIDLNRFVFFFSFQIANLPHWTIDKNFYIPGKMPKSVSSYLPGSSTKLVTILNFSWAHQPDFQLTPNKIPHHRRRIVVVVVFDVQRRYG